MKRQNLLLIAVVVFLSIGAFQPFGCKNSITGTISDLSSGNPIEGAEVTVNDLDVFTSSATTDNTGVYLITDVPYGDYTITATAEGYQQSSTTITTSYFMNGLFARVVEGRHLKLTEETSEEPEPPQGPLWVDTFQASGGTATDQSWTIIAGSTWTVIAGKYQEFTDGEFVCCSAGNTWDDYYVQADLDATDSKGSMYIYGRFQDIDNSYQLAYSNTEFSLYSIAIGTATLLDTTTTYPGLPVTAKLVMNGSSLECWLDDTLYLSATDSTFTQGIIALGALGRRAIFDNVEVDLVP